MDFPLPLIEDGTTAFVLCSLLLDGATSVDLELESPLPEGENRVNIVVDLCSLMLKQNNHHEKWLREALYTSLINHMRTHAGRSGHNLPACFVLQNL
jgi:hypothetical protein